MKVNSLFLLMIVPIVSGCYMGAKTYEIFENLNNCQTKFRNRYIFLKLSSL